MAWSRRAHWTWCTSSGAAVSVDVFAHRLERSAQHHCEGGFRHAHRPCRLRLVHVGQVAQRDGSLIPGVECVERSAQLLVVVGKLAGGIGGRRLVHRRHGPLPSLVMLLDHDDELDPNALSLAAGEILAYPNVDLIYSDEDKVDTRGKRHTPFFKPNFSPELLLCQNYIGHLVVVRRELVEAVGGFRSEYDGAQDYDLLLRLDNRRRSFGREGVAGNHEEAMSLPPNR